jgi:hypothetical protein
MEISGPIRSAWEDVSLAIETPTRESLDKMLASDDAPQRVKAKFLLDQWARGETFIDAYSAPVQVVRFGDELLMVALSGEPVVDWAVKLRSELASTHVNGVLPLVWVAGYANDMYGYLPTRRIQAEGGYEAGRASLWSWLPGPFTDDVEGRVTTAVRRLIRRVCD